jgi:hypothetical protein
MVNYFIALLIGGLRSAKVTLVGQLSLAELGVVVLGPLVLLQRAYALMLPVIRALLILGGLWLLSQIGSDFVNNTPPSDYLRGWANIGMIVASVAFFAMLFVDRPRAYLFWLVGSVVAGLLKVFVIGGRGLGVMAPVMSSEFWDYWIAPFGGPATLVIAWLVYRKNQSLSGLLLLVYGGAAIIGGARSHGMAFILGALLMLYASWSVRTGFKLNRRVLLKTAMVLTPVFAVLYVAFVQLGLSGNLGEKTERQLSAATNPYNPLTVVMTVRPTAYVWPHAVWDRPVLGHGSWASDPKYTAILAEGISTLTRGQAAEFSQLRDSSKIPIHSTIFEAWVFGGVLGALFWAYVLWMLARLLGFFVNRPWLSATPLVCVLGFQSVWHIFFSPMVFARYDWPAFMAFAVVSWLEARQQEAQPEPEAEAIEQTSHAELPATQ